MRILSFLFIFLWTFSAFAAEDLKTEFAKPGVENRPWVYWFWNNGNLTAEGIKADLEAMAKVGIGGVLIMEVGQGAPAGPVDFLSDQWRELYKYMITEANRLGIEVNMNNDAGWNGSGGKWIKPEDGMQILTWSETNITEPKPEKITLPEPPKRVDYYKDVAVLAFPTPDGATEKKAVDPNHNRRSTPNDKAVVEQKDIIDLTGKMAADGSLDWKPDGASPVAKWTILRIGHTCKGHIVGPAPTSGAGLECDKLSVKASEEAFNGQMGKLIADNKKFAGTGKTLVSTHIDSWENGSQTWTPKMREEFKERRQYDIWKFLPVFAGYIVDSTDITDRFFWDFRRTVSEMVLDNYVGTFQRLAHQHGLQLSIEGYDECPCDFLQFAGMADEPMGEFWCGGEGGSSSSDGLRLYECKGMASAGHIYGKNIVGAEAFTAGDKERWLRHPGNLKMLGDRAFCEGINRFVFHRYSFQPWKDIKPGLMMGPWGVHYERTQTWWEQTTAWHEYLSRCQFMLRQGNYVADIAYVEAEESPQRYIEHPNNGYQWDHCNTDTVLQMSVKNGKVMLPSGASYEVLVLPNSDKITPQLLKKVSELLKDGATVIGKRPTETFGLTNYPECDKQVKELGSELALIDRTPEDVLKEKGIAPDFACPQRGSFIHRQSPALDIYFVANTSEKTKAFQAAFRAVGKPELWYPESGKTVSAPIYRTENGITTILLPFEPTESVFVIFPRRQNRMFADPVVKVVHNDKTVADLTVEVPQAKIEIVKATYGPPNDAAATVDATEAVKKLLAECVREIRVADITKAVGDPKYGVVKTLKIEYQTDGQPFTASAQDNGTVELDNEAAVSLPFGIDPSGLVFNEPGKYELTTASGKKTEKTVVLSKPLELTGDWSVTFPKKQVTFDKLISWSDSPDEAVKYFSGTATYRKTFIVPKDFLAAGQRVELDLGGVHELAEVSLNGKALGVLWTREKTVDVTEFIKSGEENTLEIRVTNLWCNRLIGDEFLPPNGDRNPNGTLKSWPQWLLDGKPDPSGRQTFCMWNLWKKDDALLPSGLLGPVRLVVLVQNP
ncbi:hypothetical protein FACS1894189_3370 [Planctomycetales bacterium]|nr:hypothetical protein FACS1894189_3370 [Planctomycetales bacterium]